MASLGFKLGDRHLQSSTDPNDDVVASMRKGARKAGVALSGGALVAVGAVLTPLPTPGGILLAGAGLGLLSTEFEGAKRVMDKGRGKLVDLIDLVDDEMDKDIKVGGEGDDASQGGEAQDKSGTTKLTAHESDTASVRTAISASSATTAAPPSTARPTPSLRSGLGKLGRSIRPFLTDDDAPRRAMEDLRLKSRQQKKALEASTSSMYGRMRSHLNSVVDQMALPDDEVLGTHDFVRDFVHVDEKTVDSSSGLVETETDTNSEDGKTSESR